MSLKITELKTLRFKNESEMKAHIAANLHLIEPGLRLYAESGVQGTEVPCRVTDWGRQGSMDVLARDARGDLVVIECKLKYGDGMAFGQTLGYIVWIRRRLRELGDGTTKVRGVIVCKRANPILRLLIADSAEPIEVYEYQDAATVAKIVAPRTATLQA